MKKYSYLIIIVLISSLVLTGCLLSNVGQVPATDQSGIAYLTKGLFSGLVGWWRFDEGSGTTAYDSSGTIPPNDGTVYGADWIDGKFGKALSFDGYDDGIYVVDSSSLDFSTAITIERWIYLHSNTNDHGHSIQTVAEKNLAYYLNIQSGKLSFYWYGLSAPGYHKSPNTLPLNTWTHVAATYNGSYVKLYENGVNVYSASVTGTGQTSNWHLGIGYEPYNPVTYPRYFDGLIDEVRIWNIARTEFQLEPVVVAMDIKPGSCPNPLNVKSQALLPVAILGTEDFDVYEIDLDTIILEGVSPVKWAFEDVATPHEPTGNTECRDCSTAGPDGYLDLILHFNTQDIIDVLENGNLNTGDIVLLDIVTISAVNDGDCEELTLTGALFSGNSIKGEDSVVILKKGK